MLADAGRHAYPAVRARVSGIRPEYGIGLPVRGVQKDSMDDEVI
jgi:hypothetical protein